MGAATILIITLLIGVVLYNTWTFDSIVRWEHDNRYDDWILDGKPCGVLWRSLECSLVGSYYAMRRLQWIWLFITPGWAESVDEGRVLFRRFRLATGISTLVMVVLGIAMLLVIRNAPAIPKYNWAK